jgi:acyl carrier protein
VSNVTPADVRLFVIDFLNSRLREQRRDALRELNDDYDLFLSGVIDSLGFVELVSATSQHFGREIDLEGLDPEKMTVFGPLCGYMVSELHKP